MDVFNLFAKVSLDASDYKKGVDESVNYSKSLKSELKNVNQEVKDLSAQYKASVNSTGRYSDETKKLAEQLKEAKDKQKDLTEELKNSTSISERFGSGFSKIGSVLGTVAKGAGVVTGVVGAVGAALVAVEQSTEEYRIAMGKLTTAFEAAGYSADVAKQAYSGLYNILGDTDTATEAAQLMAKLADSAEDVSEWVNIAAGAYGTFGDALPINSLIEAANETSKVGEVVGVLADALNWAGISEDDFNAALAECSDESERNRLIMETLSATYDDASEAFYQNNEQLVQSRENQQMLDDALSEVGASVTNLKNNLLTAFTPAIQTAAGAVADFINMLANADVYASNLASTIQNKLVYAQAFAQQFITSFDLEESAKTASRVADAASGRVLGAGRSDVLGTKITNQISTIVTNAANTAAKTVSIASSGASKAVSSAAKSSASTVKKSTEEEKSYLEKLQDAYKNTADVLTTEVDNTSLAYKLWVEQAGDSVEESEKLTKQLESLTAQHEAQQKIVDAAQKAYDDYAASQDYTEEGAAELKNTLLQEKLALAELQTEIDDTSDALNKATDETEQFKSALETAFEETDNFGSAISSLGSSASDLGDVLGIDLVSDIGAMISKMGNGVSSVISFANSLIDVANSVGSITSALSSLSSIASTVSSGGGLLSTIGSILGGSTGVLGAVGVIGGAITGSSWASGISSIKDLWSSSASTADKISGTVHDLFYYGSGWGGLFDTIFGNDDSEVELPSDVQNGIDDFTSSIKDYITTGSVTGSTSAGGTTIEKVEIYIEGSQYKDEDSLAEAISIKLQSLTERKVSVYA